MRQHVALPVNVTDPAGLPAPEELRTLPVEAILRALASTRPLHEAVVDAVERIRRRGGDDEHLDPLKRFASTGQLLHRTREVSAALAGVRERVERPAVTLDALHWRLAGPFGPLAIAGKVVERTASGRVLAGEIALTLATVDVDRATRHCPEQRERAAQLVREEVDRLASLCTHEGALRDYVDEAFRRARA